MEDEILFCSWCGETHEIKEGRVIRDSFGVVLFRDITGRLHKLSRNTTETEPRDDYGGDEDSDMDLEADADEPVTQDPQESAEESEFFQ